MKGFCCASGVKGWPGAKFWDAGVKLLRATKGPPPPPPAALAAAACWACACC